MKLTRKNLKEIVKEEVAALREESRYDPAAQSGQETKDVALGLRKGAVASGVTSKERGVMSDVFQRLQAAAKEDNILGGKVARALRLLDQALESMGHSSLTADPGADPGSLESADPTHPGSRY